MYIPVHDRILWHGCQLAFRKLEGAEAIGDPRRYFPYMARGSWINDTNQTTLFTDAVKKWADPEGAQREVVDEKMSIFFTHLWIHHKESVLGRMKHAGGDACRAAVDFEQLDLDKAGEHVEDFGQYYELDHFDVLVDEPAEEYEAWELHRNGGRADTVERTVNGHVAGMLKQSTTDPRDDAEARRGLPALTKLGRALHTVADFYGHTNYVELLLWTMAWKEVWQHSETPLPAEIIASFNQPERFLITPSRRHRVCPLPADDSAVELMSKEDKTVMWYGVGPHNTPLASGLFDMRDTAYSILSMYAQHLERVEDDFGPMSQEELDRRLNMAIAIFDVPAARLVHGLAHVVQGIGDLLDAIGRAVRGALADYLEQRASELPQDSTERSAMQVTAAIVREYDSREAGEWARAARLRVVNMALESDLARKVSQHQGNFVKRQIPHHTLLNKDGFPPLPEDALRFRLACILAAEVTGELIAWHFSKRPDPQRFNTLAERYLVHPWHQLGGAFDLAALRATIDKSYGYRWTGQLATPIGVG